MTVNRWIGLFSGGKDSSFAIHSAQESGRNIDRLLTMQPTGESFLFHRPAIAITELLAESMDIPLTLYDMPEMAQDSSMSSTDKGDQEAAVLTEAIETILSESADPYTGIVSGAVASEFQFTRLEQLCASYDLEHVAPLWHCDTKKALSSMVAAGFDIRIVAVAAEGLDESWLGRQLNAEAIEELHQLADAVGIHPMGEGGEYETLVVDGPMYRKRLELTAEPQWDGVRGQLRITDAWLE